MMKPKSQIRCDECGKFVGFIDIVMGHAIRRLLTPDAEGTKETYETICRQCKNDKQARDDT